MVLDDEISKKIMDFVRIKPRSIQEISAHISKNWRTAERYVETIEEKDGCIASRIFRKGTRGALKIVYWNFSEDIHNTSFQEEIIDSLMQGKRKQDFSPFDIYQYVDDKKKKLFVEDASKKDPDMEISENHDFIGLLRQAKKQVLFFSGNLSWVNAHQKDVLIFDVIRELAKKGIPIKVLSRVSMIGADNAEKLLTINKEVGKDIVEIRHRYHPLRALIVDDKMIRLREKRDPAFYKTGELGKKIEIFYDILDKDWISWLQRVFFKMYSRAMPAEKRLKEINKIQKKLNSF